MIGVGIHDKRGGLAVRDATDVRLADVRVNLHLGQILGDRKQHRRLETGRHGLPDIHVPRDHDAVDRRVDGGVLQIDLRRIQLRLRLFHLRLRNLQIGLRGFKGGAGIIHVLLGIQLLLKQSLRAIKVELLQGKIGASPGHIPHGVLEAGFHLCDNGPKRSRIKLGHHLARLHHRVEIGIEGLDDAGYLAADLYRDDGIDRAGGRDDLGHRPALDLRSLIPDRLLLVSAPVHIATGSQNGNERNPSDDPFARRHEPPLTDVLIPVARLSWAFAA